MGFSFGRGRRSSAVAVHPQRSRNPQEEADVESGLGKIQMGRKTTVNKIDDLLGASLSDEGLEQQQAARYREALAGKGGTQRLAPPPPLPQLQPADKTPSRGSTAFFYLRDMLQVRRGCLEPLCRHDAGPPQKKSTPDPCLLLALSRLAEALSRAVSLC